MPFFSAFYNKILKDNFSVLDLACLMMAIAEAVTADEERPADATDPFYWLYASTFTTVAAAIVEAGDGGSARVGPQPDAGIAQKIGLLASMLDLALKAVGTSMMITSEPNRDLQAYTTAVACLAFMRSLNSLIPSMQSGRLVNGIWLLLLVMGAFRLPDITWGWRLAYGLEAISGVLSFAMVIYKIEKGPPSPIACVGYGLIQGGLSASATAAVQQIGTATAPAGPARV